MIADPTPITIAATTGVATLAFFAAGAVVLSLVEWVRKGKGAGPSAILGRAAGVAALCLLPLGFVSIAGFIAAALIEAVGTPAIAFPFVSIAGIAGIRAARDSGAGEMKGCSQIMAGFVACYVVLWGAVGWWMSGGNETLATDLASWRWLQPPLAALPFALTIWRISGKKRSLWLLFGSLAFLSAYLAVWFFTVEAGFGAEVLPANDWLRFPIAGLLLWLPFAIVPMFAALKGTGPSHARRLRDTLRKSLPIFLLGVPMGLAWAGARALLAA